MADGIPKTKWERGLCAGRTAAKVGGKAIAYYAFKPFRTREEDAEARRGFDRETGALLFQGLGLLRGTALKAAQLLSLEADVLPPEVTRELGKSCHQAPPINRAMARKIVSSAFGKQPEEVFRSFDSRAFAAASLGQVHRATAWDGRELAVKIQYPGIRETIHNDISMLRAAARSLPEYRMVAPALEEIQARLMEETDYQREQDNMAFFRSELKLDNIVVPECHGALSSGTVLSSDYLSGLPLAEWLNTGPDQEARDRVAQTLQDVFVAGLYQLRCIHADPNPSNFLIGDDGSVGLVDFGCVKRFDELFVSLYGKMSVTAMSGSRDEYMSLISDLRMTNSSLAPEAADRLFGVMKATGEWISRLFREEYFDFRENTDFIASGKQLMRASLELRKHMSINTNFIYLHRTRYGLLRLFESMGARVRFRNPYEYEE